MSLARRTWDEKKARWARIDEAARERRNKAIEAAALAEREASTPESLAPPYIFATAIIQSHVAQKYGLTRSDIVGVVTKANVVQPRWIAMWITREVLGTSYVIIGHRFKRDHSSVIHGIRSLKEQMDCDQSLADDVHALRAEVAAMLGRGS